MLDDLDFCQPRRGAIETWIGALSPPRRQSSFAQVGFGLEDPLLLKEGQAARSRKGREASELAQAGWLV